MTDVLIATDADAVFKQVEAALVDPGTTVRRVRAGHDVVPAVQEATPDLVVLDLQIGNMGGIATCILLRHEAIDGRLPDLPVLLLLDRGADVMLARRAGADGWVVKPLDPIQLRRAAAAVLEGRTDEDAQPAAEPQLAGDVNPL
ncbi:MAG TPA: response regulator [Acidimicrobiales bacterium]|nr:response regulator [Acidimicrobiales bacterium]